MTGRIGGYLALAVAAIAVIVAAWLLTRGTSQSGSASRPTLAAPSSDAIPPPVVQAVPAESGERIEEAAVPRQVESSGPSRSLSGFVRTKQGPVHGANLKFASRQWPGCEASSRNDGSYEIPRFRSGHWRVAITAPGCSPWAGEIDVDCPPEGCERDFVLELLSQFAIRFLDPSGVVHPEALAPSNGQRFWTTALAYPEPPCELFSAPNELKDALGWGPRVSNQWSRYHMRSLVSGKGPLGANLALSGDSAGRLDVHTDEAEVACAFAGDVLIAVAPLPGERGSIDFQFDPDGLLSRIGASLRVRVVDSEFALPLRGAVVSAWNVPDQRVGVDGVVHVEGLLPGVQFVQVQEAYHGPFRAMIELAPGEAKDLGDVALAPRSWIRGRVVDPDGKGIEQAIVEFSPPGDLVAPRRAYIHQAEVLSRADGSFDISTVGTGPWSLRVHAPSYPDRRWAENAAVVEVPARGLAGVELRLVPGIPTRVVFDHRERFEDELGLSTLEYAVRTRTGIALCRESRLDQELWLAPGDYVLVVLTGGHAGRSKPFTVRSAPAEVRFEL